MKKVCMLLGAAVVGTGLLGLTGCQKEVKDDKAPAAAAVEQATTAPAQTNAAETPASQKPKDHPAH